MSKGKRYKSEKKLAVVKEVLKGDQTINQICIKHGISKTAVNKWKKKFNENAHMIFEMTTPKKESKNENPEYLTSVIGKLTVENDILKKALGVWD